MFLSDGFAWSLAPDGLLAITAGLKWVVYDYTKHKPYVGKVLSVTFADGGLVDLPLNCYVLTYAGSWQPVADYQDQPCWLAYVVPEVKFEDSWAAGRASALYDASGMLELIPEPKLMTNRMDDVVGRWLTSRGLSYEMVGLDVFKFMLLARPKLLIDHLLAVLPGSKLSVYQPRIPVGVSYKEVYLNLPSQNFIKDGIAVCL